MHNYIIHEVPRMKNEEWGAAFRAARKEIGLTQRALADALHINISNIQLWEVGKHKPPKWVQPLLLEKLKSMASSKGNLVVSKADVESLNARLDELMFNIQATKAAVAEFQRAANNSVQDSKDDNAMAFEDFWFEKDE